MTPVTSSRMVMPLVPEGKNEPEEHGQSPWLSPGHGTCWTSPPAQPAPASIPALGREG